MCWNARRAMLKNVRIGEGISMPYVRSSPLRTRLLWSALLLAGSSLAQSQLTLSSDGRALLSTTIASGRFDLRWPDFSDYRRHVQKFYDFNGGSLWWVK